MVVVIVVVIVVVVRVVVVRVVVLKVFVLLFIQLISITPTHLLYKLVIRFVTITVNSRKNQFVANWEASLVVILCNRRRNILLNVLYLNNKTIHPAQFQLY